MIRARPSVQFATIAPAGFRLLWALETASVACKIDLELTSGTDSHALPDPHATGSAYDISVKGWTSEQIRAVVESLRESLGPAFTVLYEIPSTESTLGDIATVNPKATGRHLHLQRKRGTVYP